MEVTRNRIKYLFTSGESPFSAERLYTTREEEMLKNVESYKHDVKTEASEVISGYLDSLLVSLSSQILREQETSRDEIDLLNRRLAIVEKKQHIIEEAMKVEYELDAKLQSEIEDMEGIKIDPLKLDPKEWAPSIEDLKEYLDDE